MGVKGKKRVLWSGELGEEYAECNFEAVGETEEELIDQILEHTKTEHGITIEKGSYTYHIIQRLIHLLLMAYEEPERGHF